MLLALPALAILAVVVAIAVRGQRETAAPGGPDTTVIAVSVVGPAWIDDGGHRRSIREGDRLARGELVETAEGASVVLLDHGANVIDVRASTRFYCASSSEETVVDVEGGVLQVSVASRVSLVVHAAGSNERFRIEDGLVGIAFALAGGSVTVHEGKAFVEDGTGGHVLTSGRQWLFGATREVASPAELTLAVDHVTSRTPGARAVVLSGTTQPGALVTVNGVAAVVDADGVFSIAVPLARETSRVVVRARDASDRHRELTVALRDSTGPSKRERRIETRWRWERTPG
jgi:hypothetical protein